MNPLTWDIFSNCSCIWGGSASSRMQTGCEVLCLLSFLCDWPQCLVVRHWLKLHSKGGGKKQGGEPCMCTTCAVVWWGNQLSSDFTATRTWGCTANWNDQLCSESLEEEASRQFSFLLIPLMQSYTDSNTQPLFVGCHIHRLFSNLTGLPGQTVQLSWQRCPWFQVCFMPPTCLTHHCYTARMLLLMEKKRVLGFIFLLYNTSAIKSR